MTHASLFSGIGGFDLAAEWAGWTNLFNCVKADLMPHQIRILDVRAERLQDITDEDCLREGIVYHTKINWSKPTEPFRCGKIKETTARKAFTSLIDKISDKGTWKSNPFVWRIEFEVLTEKQQTDGRTFRKNNTSQDQQ